MAISAQEMLDKYLEAEAAVLEGKEINFNGRKLVRADLPQIIAGRKEWERRVNALASAARGNPGYSLATFR
ncbi:primosomal replication protein PriB/PriC domain protein (plasmid) [Pseudomonas sp. B26140]|uniref:primosomal replication protein PriB/PriC domain protein n=1 Tax=Pseudomonas sp. B26140 TaxID=3235112 RepID=UPI0037830F7B